MAIGLGLEEKNHASMLWMTRTYDRIFFELGDAVYLIMKCGLDITPTSVNLVVWVLALANPQRLA
jgi:hypothetical protein